MNFPRANTLEEKHLPNSLRDYFARYRYPEIGTSHELSGGSWACVELFGKKTSFEGFLAYSTQDRCFAKTNFDLGPEAAILGIKN